MATSKYLPRIGIVAVAVALLISVLLMNASALGLKSRERSMGYEQTLFDTSRVHTIDIVMDDWDGFLSTAQSEEYSLCNVVIDGEAVKQVGIRAKGNTSLSTVASMDSDRYSFKIEFDHYDSGKNYHGLDKLSLNNLIQDNTMMKDYLTYQMMNAFGVASPLCSYAYLTVNGEDWGLYLAVEAVEESFLQRNYGSESGELYKPDSMSMGGGRGNGKDFSFDDLDFGDLDFGNLDFDNIQAPGTSQPAMPGGQSSSGDDSARRGGNEMPGGNPVQGMDMGMGSDDAKLQYIDDDPDSYSTIFDSAKTDITTSDKTRLIASLKSLSAGENLEEVLDVDMVLRYFVVHNYVVNGDSYTGSMIHNYYLYEQDGQLSMIPWDYNLAFGTFQGNSADQAVNDDIDAPLSVTGSGRPMIDWIFSSEEYTRQYHALFQEFLDSVDISAIIADARALIDDYVAKDPTKFCTYEEFETGVDTLVAFCELRSQSVALQLEGRTETVDASAIKLSDMGTMNQGGSAPELPDSGNMPDMGDVPAMGNMPNMDEMPDMEDAPHMPDGQMPDTSGESGKPGQMGEMGDMPQMPGQFGGDGQNGGSSDLQMPENGNPGGQNPFQSGGNDRNTPQTNAGIGSGVVLLGMTVLILAAGLVFVLKFRR